MTLEKMMKLREKVNDAEKADIDRTAELLSEAFHGMVCSTGLIASDEPVAWPDATDLLEMLIRLQEIAEKYEVKMKPIWTDSDALHFAIDYGWDLYVNIVRN